MDQALLRSHIIIRVGSVVPPGKVLESGFLYVGSPVKQIRALNQNELEFLAYSPQNYQRLTQRYIALRQ